MQCKQCNTENPQYAKFCQKCGQPLEGAGTTEGNTENVICSGHGEALLLNRRKQIIIGGIALLAVILACIIGLVAYHSQKGDNYAGKLETANKYLQELNYEKAEAAYLEAIKIDPKREEPYMNLADLYMKQGEKEKAVGILEEGNSKAPSKKMEKKLKAVKSGEAKVGLATEDYYAYLQQTVIPDEGLADVGDFPDDESNQIGLVSAWIHDVDGDGQDEMITAISEHHKTTDFRITLYGTEHGKVVQLDVLEAEQSGDAEHYGDSSDEVFVKEHEGKCYLVIRSWGAGQSYSSSATTLSIYSLEEKINAACTINSDWYRGSDFVSIDDEEILSITDEEMADMSAKQWNRKYEESRATAQSALEPYGMAEKIGHNDDEGFLIDGYDAENETEFGISSRKRAQSGEYDEYGSGPIMEINVTDFTDLRDHLENETAETQDTAEGDTDNPSIQLSELTDCVGMKRSEIEERFGKLNEQVAGDSGSGIYPYTFVQEYPEVCILFDCLDERDLSDRECVGIDGPLSMLLKGLKEDLSLSELELQLGVTFGQPEPGGIDKNGNQTYWYSATFPDGRELRIYGMSSETITSTTQGEINNGSVPHL